MTSAAAATRPARALVAGPGARRALVPGASGAVEVAFGGGGYVALDTGRVLLAGPRAPVGPLSLLVAGLPSGGLRPGDLVSVAEGRLRVGALEVAFAAARAAPLPEPLDLRPGWERALGAALAELPAPPAGLRPGLGALARGDLAGGTTALAGRGEGLTPAGDDVLAGFAAWRWTAGRPVALDVPGCAPLGRDYLRCAERGELAAPADAVRAAVCAGDPRAAARAARGLSAWGASSGAALAWGMAAGAGHPALRLPPARGA